MARYVVRSLEYDDFTDLLTNVLFNINFQHIWYMVRRFVVGLLCTSPDPDEAMTGKLGHLCLSRGGDEGCGEKSFSISCAFTKSEAGEN